VGIETVGSPALWIAFAALIIVMMALDLGVFNRRGHTITVKAAAIWSGVWIALALLFNLFVYLHWDGVLAQEFLTGYVLEKALSVDNLFVFYMIFNAFKVEAQDQHRILFWGIIGAIVLRGAMVFGGAALLAYFHWVVYVFGGLLFLTGLKMLRRKDDAPHPEDSRLYKLLRRILPSTSDRHGGRMFARENGVLLATPLFVVLVLIELMDVVFAIDSIMAIFAITRDPFIVLTSNIFAVMGLRSLYFVLAGMATRFVYLQPGLAIVLMFVGTKMALSSVYKLPVLVSLAVITLLLGGSIIASLHKTRKDKRQPALAI
jgi:tellurite resistance protein TerC